MASHPDFFRIANRKALFLWVFMAFWFAMLFVFTYLFFTEETPKGLSLWMPLILLVFYLVGFGALRWAFGHPIVSLMLVNGRVVIRERFLVQSRSYSYSPDEVLVLPVRQDKDSEGDPYFLLEVKSKDRTFVIWESHSQEEAAQKRNALMKTWPKD